MLFSILLHRSLHSNILWKKSHNIEIQIFVPPLTAQWRCFVRRCGYIIFKPIYTPAFTVSAGPILNALSIKVKRNESSKNWRQLFPCSYLPPVHHPQCLAIHWMCMVDFPVFTFYFSKMQGRKCFKWAAVRGKSPGRLQLCTRQTGWVYTGGKALPYFGLEILIL